MNFSIPKSLRGLFYSVTTLVVFVVLFLVVNAVLFNAVRDARVYEQRVLELTDQGQFDQADANYLVHLESLESGQSIEDNLIAPVSLSAFVAPEVVDLNQTIAHIRDDNHELARVEFASILSVVSSVLERKESLLFIIQLVVGILVLLFYCAVVFQMFRRAGTADSTQQQAKTESEGIMSTISEGLFLMKSDFEIGIEQSASLKEMFRSERDLEGNFFDFIGEYVTPSTQQIAKDFIELLFGERVKEKLIADLNPLNEVEINILRRDGSYEHRYLNFSFKRVMNHGQLSHLLCSVTDITREVELAKQLENAQEEQEAQLDLLMSVLHVDPQQLARFFGSADKILNDMNMTLEQHSAIHEKEKHSDSAIRGKLDEIAAMAHRLKGDAAILQLRKFEFGTHDLEEELQSLQKSREKLDGKSLLPLVGRLRELFGELENMRSLVEKFASVVNSQASDLEATKVLAPESLEQSVGPAMMEGSAQVFEELASEHEIFVEQLQQLVETVANRQGKQVDLQLDVEDMPTEDHMRDAIKDIAVQLVRNSVVHGVETMIVRSERNKSERGRVALKLQRTQSDFRLIVIDDGAGLDVATIERKAKALGLITGDQVVDERLAMSLIFKPGFSSRDDADLDGGRGVGLDVVMRQVKSLRGKIAMKQQSGKQCKFSVVIPV